MTTQYDSAVTLPIEPDPPTRDQEQRRLLQPIHDSLMLLAQNSGGGGGGGGWYFQDTPPASPVAGDRWVKTTTGIEYTWVTDANSSQWVELGPYCGGGAGVPLALKLNLPGVLRNIWVDSSGGINGGTLDGVNVAPGIVDTGDHIRRTWRRRNENQNNTSLTCVNAYYTGYGGIHNAQYSSFLISWVFGFDQTSTHYRAAQGCFAGLANTLPSGVLTGITGNSFWSSPDVNTLIGIGLDFSTNTWVAVTKDGTAGARTTVSMGVTRVPGSVYKAVVWKEGGNNAINFYLERTDPATGLVAESNTVQIAFANCPATRVRPWLAIANSVTNDHTCSVDIHGSIFYTHWTGVDQITGTGSGGGVGVQYQDEGVNLGSAGTVDTIDFTGTGVTASRSGNKVTVNVPDLGPFGFLQAESVACLIAPLGTGFTTYYGPWQNALGGAASIPARSIGSLASITPRASYVASGATETGWFSTGTNQRNLTSGTSASPTGYYFRVVISTESLNINDAQVFGIAAMSGGTAIGTLPFQNNAPALQSGAGVVIGRDAGGTTWLIGHRASGVQYTSINTGIAVVSNDVLCLEIWTPSLTAIDLNIRVSRLAAGGFTQQLLSQTLVTNIPAAGTLLGPFTKAANAAVSTANLQLCSIYGRWVN